MTRPTSSSSVDDHAIFRSGVRAELEGLVDVLGDVGSVEEAVRMIAFGRLRNLSAQIFRASTARSMAGWLRRPLDDSPSPSLTMRENASTTRNWPGRVGTATSSRQLLVPRSSAAKTGCSSGRTRPEGWRGGGAICASILLCWIAGARSPAGAAPAAARCARRNRRDAVACENLAAAPSLAPLLASRSVVGSVARFLVRARCRPKRGRHDRHCSGFTGRRSADAPPDGEPPLSGSCTFYSFMRRANLVGRCTRYDLRCRETSSHPPFHQVARQISFPGKALHGQGPDDKRQKGFPCQPDTAIRRWRNGSVVDS